MVTRHFGPVMVQIDEKNTWTAEQTFSSDTFIANGYGLTVGHTAQVALNVIPEFQVMGGAQADASCLMGRFSDDAAGPVYYFLKSRHATVGANTIVQNNDDLGYIVWQAADGSDFVTAAAQIDAQVDGTPGTNDVPGRIRVLTTADGGSTVTERMRITSTGNVFIGDTANTFMTQGLTINQGAADDELISGKSSDVAHGMTAIWETDTYFRVQKQVGAEGGVGIAGISETVVGISLLGASGTESTVRTTGASACIQLEAYTKGGTTVTTPSADANLVCIRAGSTTRFILDADGDSHQDVGTAWTNFDAYDDPALLQDLRVALSRPDDPLRQHFNQFVNYNRGAMELAKLVTFNDDGHNFVNMSRLAMLHTSAIVQLSKKIEDLESNIVLLTEGRN